MKKKICPKCGKPYDKEFSGGYIHYTTISHTVCNKTEPDKS
jgi:hypothetical protein